jgi:disulfide bond formation protein DsbB
MAKTLTALLSQPRNATILLILFSLGALGTAFTSQYVFGLAPCKLCIYQRWPYGIVIALALIGLLLSGRAQASVLLLCAATLLGDGAIAVYHVGVEQAWWPGPSGCSANFGGAKTLDDLRRQLMATAPVRCDEIAWSLFGVSFAGYNAIFATLAAAFAAMVGHKNIVKKWEKAEKSGPKNK